MTDDRPRRPPAKTNVENDLSVNTMALQGIQRSLIEIKKELSTLSATVGTVGTDDHGALIGTGIAGDLGRLKEKVDKRFGRYDAWSRYAAGAVAGFGFMALALWWVIQEKIGKILKGG